jgi:5-formyltetrahydrofolate cyclo-ligase
MTRGERARRVARSPSLRNDKSHNGQETLIRGIEIYESFTTKNFANFAHLSGEFGFRNLRRALAGARICGGSQKEVV